MGALDTRVSTVAVGLDALANNTATDTDDEANLYVFEDHPSFMRKVIEKEQQR